MMSNSAKVALLLSTAAVSAVLHAQIARTAAPFNGRLYAAAINANPTALGSADRNRVAPSLRPRFERFLKCQSAFRSRLPKSKDFFSAAALPKEQMVERGIACLIEAPGIAELATQYAATARILYEWEGLSSSPLEEADYAEEYIDAHPDSPLKPYLYLFIAQRMRYTFEFLSAKTDPAEWTVVAARYRANIARARNADPLIALVADDLDALPFVSKDVGKHPSDN